MSKKYIPLAPLADHIVSKTPPLSYKNKTELFLNIVRRNSNKLNGNYKSCEILVDMVEIRLIKRDGSL